MAGASTSISSTTCNDCFEKDGCCLISDTDCGFGNVALKEGYRQFYDCKSGGKSGTLAGYPVNFCKIEKNHKYNAVIIVPVLAFVGIIAGLVYVFRSKIFGYSAPPEQKAVEIQDPNKA